MDNWDEIRTAYHVARAGTVSGAAEALGVHHATVIRHIDALEGRLGVKLFQRHARGYTATEAGQDLLKVAELADDQFTQLAGRIKGRGDEVTGELIVTSLEEITTRLIPCIAAFQELHPDLRVRLISDSRLFRLEYGEAHVALRAGAMPEQPDNVVQHFLTEEMRLVATRAYADAHGPLTEETMPRHRFIGPHVATPRAPFYQWMLKHVPEDRVVFRASTMRAAKAAIAEGMGIGFVSRYDRELAGLVEMLPTMEEWSSRIWMVTHMDLHRTAKVQAFVRHLKATAAAWQAD